MGIISSMFRRKITTAETLSKLNDDWKKIEERKTFAHMRHEKIKKLFFIYFIVLYILMGIYFYVYFSSLKKKFLYAVPIALSPLLLFVISKIVSWHYKRSIRKDQIRLEEIKKKKKKILDEVMNKETYKVAKEILDKFSSDPIVRPIVNQQIICQTSPAPLRRRIVSPMNSVIQKNLPVLMGNKLSSPLSSAVPARLPTPPGSSHRFPLPSTPAPLFPPNRSYMDKLVEYLIGDGPNNRYALICSRCHSHNGMALKEEFEYIGFKCFYCSFYNTARKLRPEAPKLLNKINLPEDPDSDADSNSSVEVISTDSVHVASKNSDGEQPSSKEKEQSTKHEGEENENKLSEKQKLDSGSVENDTVQDKANKTDEKKENDESGN